MIRDPAKLIDGVRIEKPVADRDGSLMVNRLSMLVQGSLTTCLLTKLELVFCILKEDLDQRGPLSFAREKTSVLMRL